MTDTTDFTARDALEIAHHFGMTLRRDRKIIREGIIAARATAALPGVRDSARTIFTNDMADVDNERRIDALAARDFEDAAYGPAPGSQRWAEDYADARADAADYC